jgi:chromosome segregation ATPase
MENKEYIEFEEYYENNSHHQQDEHDENDFINYSKSKNTKSPVQEGVEINNDDDFELEQEREEMENDFELVKCLNDLKDKNKKLESVNKYQNIKIESLQGELDKALNELRLREMEIDELRSKSGIGPMSPEYKKNLNLNNQINNLNLQVDKYKSLLADKKSEFNGLLEKYNELQKIVDKNQSSEKKLRQEITSKDKQIARLLEEIDKKNLNTPSSKSLTNDKEIEKLSNEVKKLEKQKNELYVAFKKSLKLCSILKRQKVHLENARLLAFTEDEFKQLLEQNKI